MGNTHTRSSACILLIHRHWFEYGEYPPGVFSSEKPKNLRPLIFIGVNFETPYFFPYKFDTPYFTEKFQTPYFFDINLTHLISVAPLWFAHSDRPFFIALSWCIIFAREFPAVGFPNKSLSEIVTFGSVSSRKIGQSLKLIRDPLTL